MNRRSFLVVLAALTAVPRLATSRGAIGPVRDPYGQPLDVVVPDVEAAARLGRHYLASREPPPTAERLLAEITQAMGPTWRDPAGPDEASAIARVRRVVTDDYLQGRVADVDGWVLSLTEARFFALAALEFPVVD
jgi:hypothetical protein